MRIHGIGSCLPAAFAALSLCAAVPAFAETTKCTAITAVPYTITAPGIYCVTAKITTNLASGAAIAINANNVVLDLNNFAIGNLAALPTTGAKGVEAIDRQNIVVRNGILRGFWSAIALHDGTLGTSSGHVVTGITSDHSYRWGIWVDGPYANVSGNTVLSTLGSTLLNSGAQGPAIAGAIIVEGSNAVIANNIILETDCTNVCGATAGASAIGILLQPSTTPITNSVITGNQIVNSALPSAASNYAVLLSSSTKGFISNNYIANFSNGVYIDPTTSSTGDYYGNGFQGVTTTATGGTALGTSNY